MMEFGNSKVRICTVSGAIYVLCVYQNYYCCKEVIKSCKQANKQLLGHGVLEVDNTINL